ncbi:MAG: ABC transporter permease [Bacteroidetes bacterium]|nr:ABC transporter permease [Bacteroidota bacterium]
MLKNYLKTAWRSLLKNKLSAFINVGGLSIGMAVAMLIACWIYDEWSYDRQFGNFHSIGQVWETWPNNAIQRQLPAAVADELRAKFGSNFKRVVLSSMTGDHILTFGEKKVIKAGNFIENEGLGMFTVPMLEGGREGLRDPHSILLSESLAKTIFGSADAVGRVLKMDDTVVLKVTGIYKDFPYNSSFRDVTFLAPWELYEVNDPETRHNRHSWGDNNWQTFVQMADNTNMAAVSAKIKEVKAINDPYYDSTGRNQNTVELFLHPMSRWHLYADHKDGNVITGRIMYVRLFGIIGVFVLLLACINFMNLSTARSEKRAKEVGIRKTLGSMRGQLVGQFFCESLLVAFLALVIALGLVQLSMPFFNQLAESKISIPWLHPLWWASCIGFSVFTGVIAGSYPALYLSSFRPVKVLKGVFRVGRMASLPRKVLVVTQFTVSIVMIIGTIIIFRQVQYSKNRPVGYSQEGLFMMQMHTGDVHGHFVAFRDELLRTGVVSEVAESVAPVTASWPFNGGLTWSGHLRSEAGDRDFSMKGISLGYSKTVGLKFLAGRDFRTEASGFDSKTMIINETAARLMGFKDPIGKTVTWMKTNFTVIGMVKDVVMESPYESPVPALYYLAPYTMTSVTCRINPLVNGQEAMSRIAPVFAKYAPAEPFDFKWVDSEYGEKFRNEMRIGELAGFFTAFAILISCLGLFGLASFVAEQRTKEIGVRKVLGASLFNLWGLLSKDFVLLIALSCLIAIPVASWALHRWLEGFAYRTELSWWIFAVAGAGAIVITLLTVSYQSIKSALMNPTKSLRTE